MISPRQVNVYFSVAISVPLLHFFKSPAHYLFCSGQVTLTIHPLVLPLWLSCSSLQLTATPPIDMLLVANIWKTSFFLPSTLTGHCGAAKHCGLLAQATQDLKGHSQYISHESSTTHIYTLQWYTMYKIITVNLWKQSCKLKHTVIYLKGESITFTPHPYVNETALHFWCYWLEDMLWCEQVMPNVILIA